MNRTAVYLPDELKRELERLARETGESEAELIREGVRSVLASRAGDLRPGVPLFNSGAIGADRADALLASDDTHPAFGEA